MNNRYRIGAVARLTGIPTDTLRIWERRYDVVNPERTEKGGRLYSQDDVTRLTMIKTLVDQGHAISTVAALGAQELQARLSGSQRRHTPATGHAGESRVCVIGETLSVRVTHANHLPAEISLAGVHRHLQAWLDDDSRCDVLIVELPFLDSESSRLLRDRSVRDRAPRVIVVYAFAPSTILAQLRRAQVVAEQAPISLERLWQHCASPLQANVDTAPADFDPAVVSTEPVPARQFSAHQLALLSQTTSTLKCECPHHMSGIIETLAAFEEYSAECENATRQDAALHAYLHIMTAKARWLMETALHKLAEVEGIDIGALDKGGDRRRA